MSCLLAPLYLAKHHQTHLILTIRRLERADFGIYTCLVCTLIILQLTLSLMIIQESPTPPFFMIFRLFDPN